jgi:hypothetical protein
MKSWLLMFNRSSIILAGTRRSYLGTAWAGSWSFGLLDIAK